MPGSPATSTITRAPPRTSLHAARSSPRAPSRPDEVGSEQGRGADPPIRGRRGRRGARASRSPSRSEGGGRLGVQLGAQASGDGGVPPACLGAPAGRVERLDDAPLRGLVERPKLGPSLGVPELGGPVTPRVAFEQELLVGHPELAAEALALGLHPAPEALPSDVVHPGEEVTPPPLDGAGWVAPGQLLLERAGVEAEACLEPHRVAVEDQAVCPALA